MTEHVKPNNGGGFEREDLGTRPIFGFLVSLVVTGVLVYYVLWGMFHFMDAYDRKHQHTKSPMVQAEQDTREPNSEKTYEKIKQQFPEPRLEDDERTELNDSRYQQDETLSSYGWVDQSGGGWRKSPWLSRAVWPQNGLAPPPPTRRPPPPRLLPD